VRTRSTGWTSQYSGTPARVDLRRIADHEQAGVAKQLVEWLRT
jgi:hypothetical protein